MYTLKVLVVIAAAAASIARPSGEELQSEQPTARPPAPATAISQMLYQIFAKSSSSSETTPMEKTNLDLKAVVAKSFLDDEPEPAMKREQEMISFNPSQIQPPVENKEEVKKSTRLIATDGDGLTFALKPSEDGFYDLACDNTDESEDNMTTLLILEETPMEDRELERTLRQGQDPKSESLVTEGRLKAGLSTEGVQGTAHTRYNNFGGYDMDVIYGLPLLIGVCVAFSLAIVGFVFSWSALSKKAKAAAEVEYPAYGVTGPSMEPTGDRKLAHSAHIYHYQHQKQQIMAMEKTDVDTRNGSVSDPESEEENNDGDYTVYECPGFATTGEMEVKNPMFKDEPTPGKSGVKLPKTKE